MRELCERIKKAGIENVLFLVPLRPLRQILFMTYTTSSDEPVLVPAKIEEDRYKVDENYKLTLKPIYPAYETRSFYVMDLESMIQQGSVQLYVKDQGVTSC